MADRLIKLSVFKNQVSYGGAKITIGGHPKLSTKSDDNGKATISYPSDISKISIYVEGRTVFDDYCCKLPNPVLVEL
ncbi:hypothetical protein ACN1T8_001480 [Vibrio cholerae]|uniref:hypothetical protein n=1 Tax=Vibrio cholerae TaxID=666 RepID=UPI001C92C956|nr:hypothetical protein [Vibrio cholerae]MBY4642126.1 hypothetical protein [Vibrio cholerae]MCR9658398.1 hypothetical protein [Vibrio cholerae]MCR9689080.1 hypothetical protein [Vibrio cholerae]MCR9737587.1 hypothetical protein [Vibrio cholerae]MCR9746411.1 hypothetical protein [Vibrio cholerae]